MPLPVWIALAATAILWSWWRGPARKRFAWWLMGCPFTGWRGPDDAVPWDYRLGMRLMPVVQS